MIITITEVTQEFAKNGAEYMKVKGTTQDGKEVTKSIFDNLQASWPLLEEGTTLDFKMEKKGQFWNVIEISAAKEPQPEEATAALPSKAEVQMSKDDWAEKDRITRKSIERQKSLDLAIKVVELLGIKTGITEKAIATAKIFELYLEG